MKKIFFVSILLILVLFANISLASYDTVTMTVVEEPVCTIELGENSSFEKRLIEKNLNNKEVTLQLQVTNNEIASQQSGEIMLVIDNSDSMNDIVEGTTTRKDVVIEAANTLVNAILEQNSNIQIGVVSFSTNEDVSLEGTIQDASLVSDLSSDAQALTSSISSIQASGPRTDLDAGLTLASQYFTEENNDKYVIILTDGVPNVAIDYDKVYYSDDVINKTRESLLSLGNSGYNVFTMLTGISNEDDIPATLEDKTYGQIIEEIFGTEENPTIGNFYYVSDDEIIETVTNDIYLNLIPVEQVLNNITITDYFPQEIIDNFEFAYVSEANIGTISAEVDPETNSITWTIPELRYGETAVVQYTLKLKQDFDSSIVGQILDTNERVDITYTDLNGEEQNETSDITPKLRLTEPPATLPAAGRPLVIACTVAIIGLAIYFFIRFSILNRNSY